MNLIVYSTVASAGLLLYDGILSFYIPVTDIDETNKSFQNYPILQSFVFLFIGALFEEILFRGIIQSLLYLYLDNQLLSIFITTILFLSLHIQYFKKPIMLLNILIPSLTFGWIFAETNNILVPLIAHFIMNYEIILLFKYNLLELKER